MSEALIPPVARPETTRPGGAVMLPAVIVDAGPAALRRDAAEDLGAAGAGRLTRGRVQRKAGEERAQVWSGV